MVQNAVPQTWGVVTCDKDKAFQIFTKVEAELCCLIRRVEFPARSTEYATCMYDDFQNGVRLIWLNPTDFLCGAMISRAWIDSDLDEEYRRKVLSPMLIHAKPEDITYF